MSFEDLLLDNGEIVRLEINDKYYDEFMEMVNNSMKTGDWLYMNRFDGCKAEYRGTGLKRVAMWKVVGML